MGSQPAPIGTPPLLVFRIRNQLDSSISTGVPIRCRNTPGQLRDLASPQASLRGKQDDHPVTEGMPGAGSKNQEVVDVAKG